MVKQRSSDLHRGFKLSRCELRLARQISIRVASCCTCCASWIFLDATHNMSTAVRSHEAHTSIRSRAARVKHLPPGPAKRRQVDGNDKASVKAVLAPPWAVQWGEAEGEGLLRLVEEGCAGVADYHKERERRKRGECFCSPAKCLSKRGMRRVVSCSRSLSFVC